MSVVPEPLVAEGQTSIKNKNNQAIKRLLDRWMDDGTVAGMKHVRSSNGPCSIAVPAKYRLHFTDAEFKFRWVDALKLEDHSWRTSTDLFVAMMLNTYMDLLGTCYPGIPTLAKAMKKSPETVRRSLRRLEETGWLLIDERVAETNLYTAVLPVYGLELLLEARNRTSGGETAEEWQKALDSILHPVAMAIGMSVDEWSVSRDWARLEGRLRQVIQRLGGPRDDLGMLRKHLLEELPQHVKSPTGYLLHRLADFSRRHSHLSGRKIPSAREREKSVVLVKSIVEATAS